MESVFGDKMSVDKIGPDLTDDLSDLQLTGDECKIEVVPSRGQDMLGNAGQHSVHGIVRDQVNRMSSLYEIFRPALGMDAAAVSDEEEDHTIPIISRSSVFMDRILSPGFLHIQDYIFITRAHHVR